VEDQQEDGLMT